MPILPCACMARVSYPVYGNNCLPYSLLTAIPHTQRCHYGYFASSNTFLGFMYRRIIFFFLCLLFMSYWQTIKRVLGLPRFCFRFVDLTLQIRITDVADVCCLSCCLCICNCTCRCLIFSHRSTSGVLIVSMPLPPTTNTTMVSGQETCWQTRNWSARA